MILLDPVVSVLPALYPIAILPPPEVSTSRVFDPIPIFLAPVVAISRAFRPSPILSVHRKCKRYAVEPDQTSKRLSAPVLQNQTFPPVSKKSEFARPTPHVANFGRYHSVPQTILEVATLPLPQVASQFVSEMRTFPDHGEPHVISI